MVLTQGKKTIRQVAAGRQRCMVATGKCTAEGRKKLK